ncbi:MAG: class I SAM-dependent methyltransferase [Ferrovibrio sp.]|uniref:class I SAM-dependent methyltransferase n=1 Tax=Ferrovibrio sp. TaxID=1917215 RepID=UPI00391881A5
MTNIPRSTSGQPAPANGTKLHLGCGQRYLDGYLNIDFPLNNHTVQQASVADLHADICGLHYAPGSIAEVRLHHVFEHFRRPVASALLATWHGWLADGGRLHIEVPDMLRTLLTLLHPLRSFNDRAVAERHLFGSHEADWAAHYEGYTAKDLCHMVKCFGFEPIEIRRNGWKQTHNIEIIAVKPPGSALDHMTAARTFLRNFLVDDTEGELALLETWMVMFAAQYARGQASK